jgi:hypothetical protein
LKFGAHERILREMGTNRSGFVRVLRARAGGAHAQKRFFGA